MALFNDEFIVFLQQMASQIPITIRAQPVAASSAALRGKKRPGSPAVSAVPQSTGNGSKKKKSPQTVIPTPPSQVTTHAHTGVCLS